MKNPPAKIAEAYLQKYKKSDGTLMNRQERDAYDSKLRSEIDMIRSDELSRKRRAEAESPRTQKQKVLDYYKTELDRVYTDKERKVLQQRIKAAKVAVDAENAAFEREHEIAQHVGTRSLQEYLTTASLRPEQRARLEAIQSFYHNDPDKMHARAVEVVNDFRAEDRQRAEKELADAQHELLKTQAEASQKVLDIAESESASAAAQAKLTEGVVSE